MRINSKNNVYCTKYSVEKRRIYVNKCEETQTFLLACGLSVYSYRQISRSNESYIIKVNNEVDYDDFIKK